MKKRAGGLSAQLSDLAKMKKEVQQLLGSLVTKIDWLSNAYSRADQLVESVREAAEGFTGGKGKVGRPAGKGKVGRPAGKGKVGRPAGSKGKGKTGDLPAKLKAYRKEKKINQEELAKKLDIHVASIRAYEQGRSFPRESQMESIAKLLGVAAEEFQAKPRKARKAAKAKKAPKAKAKENVAPEASQAAPEGEKTEEKGS